jgi:ABC-type branched-subunit amino acid transport system substrate-binding protein
VVGPVYRDAGIPLVVPNATSKAIRDLGTLVFPIVADDAEEGAFLSRMALAASPERRVTIFHVSDEFGIGIRDGVRNALADAGVTPLDVVEYGLRRLACPDDFQAFVDASLLRGMPEAVVLAGRNPDAACIARLVAARAPDVRVVVADGVTPTPGWALRIGPAADRVRVVQFWSPRQDSASAAFAQAFERAAGSPADQGTALRWDGVRLLVAAVREVGARREAVADYLRSLGTTRPPYHGVTGDISFGTHAHTLMVVDAWGRPVPSPGS